MKKIIILFFFLAILAGGGAGAYFFFLQPAEAAGQEAGEHAKAKEDAHGGGHGSEGGVEFVELDPLILPILDNNGVSQTVSIVIALEVKDAHGAEMVNKMTPRLKDAYIQELYGVLNHSAAKNKGAIKINILKRRLNKMTVKVLGKDVVQDVLLQVVQQRGA